MKRESGETYVRSQSFLSESAVNYFDVGRRKIQISPPLGERDQSNVLLQGQQRQSNPHPMPCPPRLYIDRCITQKLTIRPLTKLAEQGTKLRLIITVANAPKFTLLATKIHKLVVTLATRTLQVPYILPICKAPLNKG